LIEDDTLLRNQLRVLFHDDYDVLSARGGVEAFEIYDREKGRIDVVVTDYVMPRLDGARLPELLVSQDPLRPIIMVSGSVGGNEIERLSKLPKFVLLWKPFDVKVLLELVEGFTGRPEKRRGIVC
jgi:two-component system cell cycle sensor histidine kinase/response regulator CckA